MWDKKQKEVKKKEKKTETKKKKIIRRNINQLAEFN